MDISQLWSTHPGIVVGIAVAITVALVVVVVCCCRRYCNNSTTPRKFTYPHTPSDLESGSLNGFKLTIKPPPKPRRTKGGYTLVETDGPEDDPDFPVPTVNSVTQERPIARVPSQFHDFIIQKIIPYFNGQRIKDYQFAVVVLLSESDFENICQTSFIPSDSGKPILNKIFPAMPRGRQDYGNYIVARPISNSYHSEEEIFGKYSVMDSPFSHLWSSYVERSGAYPKCVLIYSWNLPCTRCTEAIIRSLGEEPYNRVSVIVAHTQVWMLESPSDRNKNREKLASKNITVQQVSYPTRISPAQL